jgi:hypothetical protein
MLRRSLVALACMAGFGGTALAQTVVVRSGGPSAKTYPAGKALATAARITLAKGDTLVLLDNRGMRTLRGPGTFGAQATTTAASQSFASLVQTQNRRRARTGATRNPLGVRPPSLWFVDMRNAATMCVADTSAVQLWRPDMQTAQTVTITEDASGRKAELIIPKGQNALSWPVAAMPVNEGKSYTLNRDSAAPVRIRFTMMATVPADPLAAYQALGAKGCTVQAGLMIDTMQAAETKS